jgi:hypothetical protein
MKDGLLRKVKYFRNVEGLLGRTLDTGFYFLLVDE